jgi:hypothetical protein
MQGRNKAAFAVLAAVVVAVSILATRHAGNDDESNPGLPAVAAFVGRDQCVDCHAGARRVGSFLRTTPRLDEALQLA